MNIYKKLELHLEESFIHINRLLDVLNFLEKSYPLTHVKLETLSLENKDKLDVLVFRFSKLQTLFKPVDIVLSKDKNRLIEKEAMKGMIFKNTSKQQSYHQTQSETCFGLHTPKIHQSINSLSKHKDPIARNKLRVLERTFA